jgi:hypothetical protein
MTKPIIALTCIGMALTALVAAPFAANQWLTVVERNHAYERQLSNEKAQAQAQEEEVDNGLREAVNNSFADEFAKDPEEFRKHHLNMTRDEFQEMYDWAKARYLAKNPGWDVFFDRSHPSFEELYGSPQSQR